MANGFPHGSSSPGNVGLGIWIIDVVDPHGPVVAIWSSDSHCRPNQGGRPVGRGSTAILSDSVSPVVGKASGFSSPSGPCIPSSSGSRGKGTESKSGGNTMLHKESSILTDWINCSTLQVKAHCSVRWPTLNLFSQAHEESAHETTSREFTRHSFTLHAGELLTCQLNNQQQYLA